MNSFLVEKLNQNRSAINTKYSIQLDFIINKLNGYSNGVVVSFSQLESLIPIINIGTPENPNDVPLKNVEPELFNYLNQYIILQFKQKRVESHINIINTERWVYGQPAITLKEKEYITRLVGRLNLEKIDVNKLDNFFIFLDQIVIPFLNKVRSQCSDASTRMDPLISFEKCDADTKQSIETIVSQLETTSQANFGFIANPENSLNIDVKQENNFLRTSQNTSLETAKLLVNSQVSQNENETSDNTNTNEGVLDSFLNEIDNANAYDKSDTVDLSRQSALGVGNPYFDNQVKPDAPFFTSRFKNLSKRTQTVVIDVYPGTSATYPYAITNYSVNFSENLIVAEEADVQLEFLNLHELQGNSTVAGRKSLEHFHGFILKINELTKYMNTISNMSDLSGQYYIPNDTFGFQDNNETNIIDSGLISAVGVDNPTLITLKNNSNHSKVDDYYNNYYFKITSGAGEGQISKINDYDGTNLRLTLSEELTTLPSENDSFEILQLPDSNRTLNSIVFKLKNSFICTMRPERISNFTISLSGIEHAQTASEPLYLASKDARLQIGLHIKER
jgi:hypothetical protein